MKAAAAYNEVALPRKWTLGMDRFADFVFVLAVSARVAVAVLDLRKGKPYSNCFVYGWRDADGKVSSRDDCMHPLPIRQARAACCRT